jgi:multicomponent Na+:H+ antiporter subunit A
MVKAGVFLLARLFPALGQGELWTMILVPFGSVTMLGGALLAVSRTDLKEILAYTTISALGTLVLLVGIGSPAALAAMVVFLTVHALYKSSLFLVAANIDQRTGTRDLKLLGGLGRLMPLTGLAALLAALGQAGAPPALGYMGKKLALKAKLELAAYDEWLILAAVLTNVAMVALALAVVLRPFGRKDDPPLAGSPVGPNMVAGPLILGILGVAVGLVPSAFDTHLGSAAASAVAGQEVFLDLKVWSGLSLQSLMLMGVSLFVFAAGYLLYTKLHLFHARPHLPAVLAPASPTILYDRILNGFLALAGRLTALVQGGRLRNYVGAVAAAAGLGALFWLAPEATRLTLILDEGLSVHGVLLVGIMAAGALGAALDSRPIVAVLCVGMTGLGLALVFALFSGVDLAITQLLVETLMVVILVAVLSRLPGGIPSIDRSFRPLRLFLAVILGSAASLAVLLTAGGQGAGRLSQEILARAWPEAVGRNVVNVILVDFRALDTLGEVVVVAAAALTVAALVVAGRRVRP